MHEELLEIKIMMTEINRTKRQKVEQKEMENRRERDGITNRTAVFWYN